MVCLQVRYARDDVGSEGGEQSTHDAIEGAEEGDQQGAVPPQHVSQASAYALHRITQASHKL